MRICQLDASSQIVTLLTTADFKALLAQKQVDGTPLWFDATQPEADQGWLRNKDGTYSDTPTAQAIRAQRATDEAAQKTIIDGIATASAVVIDIEKQTIAAGRTNDEMIARLLYGLIQRTDPKTRSDLENKFIAIVDQADANTKPAVALAPVVPLVGKPKGTP